MASATFQRLMQNCLGELNLKYCLMYLDDVIVFSKTEKEHLQCLCVVFKCFWEHNLKFKPSKYKFFHNEINYLAHHVSKEGVQPSKENLKAVTEFAPPQTYTEIWAFPGLVGHYWQFIKGFAQVHMWVSPWPFMSVIIILPSKRFWPWSGQLLNSSRNTFAGNHLLWKLTITHLPTFWLLQI